MRQSKLFTKTRREAPADEVSKNAQLLIRAGFIHKEMAGVYAYLPLGLRVLENIKRIVREEMEGVGGQEIIMTSLQRKELWEITDRWNDDNVDVWFKSELKNGTEVGFGWSHEEPITDMMKQFIASYRDLPAFVYQFQTKLRNELRAKSGIMRGREFVMKDMYSYTKDEEEHNKFYNSVINAYKRVFERVGLGDKTYVTRASGGAFTEYSHEFQTLSDAGEDTIYIHKDEFGKGTKMSDGHAALNKEIFTEAEAKEMGDVNDFVEAKSIEVGNIFNFGGAKSKELGLFYVDEAGEQIPVHLGSYGIGITRLMGTIVEIFSDDKGLVWPEAVAPFLVHLVCVVNDPTAVAYADALYEDLKAAGVSVLYDDRDARAGEKLADADLIGIPARVVIGKQTLETGKIESTYRPTGQTNLVSREDLIAFAKGAQERHG